MMTKTMITGIMAHKNIGVAEAMTMNVVMTSQRDHTKFAIWLGINISKESTSAENLLMILPRGLVSKKIIGLLITPFSKAS